MRRILVTGGNKGIGLAIVGAVLDEHDDTFVFLGSRDLGRGRAARDRLVRAHPSWADRSEVIELDVSSDASVHQAARWIRERSRNEGTPLYAVVNNAGVGGASLPLASVLEVNTFGVRRVCEATLPLLDPERGRIVNITSAAGPSFVASCSPERQRFLTDPGIEWSSLAAFLAECLAMSGGKPAFEAAGLGDGNAYGLSKACANAYTLCLARQHPGLRVNACTPGFIETDMTRAYVESQGKTPAELGMKTPSDGARAAMFLLFGEPEGNGRYYGSDGLRSPLDRYRSPGSPPYRDDA
ncbi:MAG TPA: SDR family NAD(P)-dependent oxidoreductase [Polyangiaceae bacterium]